MEEEDLRRKLVRKYTDLKAKINDSIFKSSNDPFFRAPLEDLQKIVNSMEPMVEDMKNSEITSPQYTFMTTKFLPLVDNIHSFLEPELPVNSPRVGKLKASICNVLGIKLPASNILAATFKNEQEIIQKRLKEIFADYVQEELDKLALADLEEVDEVALERVLRYLLSKIRDETSKPSSKPVFPKLEVILDSLYTEFQERRNQPNGDMLPTRNIAWLLYLLKEVQLLRRFLHGHHGLDIPYLLREREKALRTFVTDDVVLRLKQLDQKYEKQRREEEIGWMLLGLVGAFFILTVMLSDAMEDSKSELFFSILLVYTIIVLSAILMRSVYNHINLEQSNYPCSGGLCLLSFAAVVGVVALALAMVAADEPKKYDIFLNFRNDVRFTLPGFFHYNLEKANFSTFFDEKSSPKTNFFWNDIENAISTSNGAITIFSIPYSKSKDCLEELRLIVERKKTNKDYIIRPIFFDVRPSDLYNPESLFGQGLQKHYENQAIWQVEKWKEALEFVTHINADVYKSDRKHMVDLVNNVVEDFKNQLGNKRVNNKNIIQRWKQLLIMKVKRYRRV